MMAFIHFGVSCLLQQILSSRLGMFALRSLVPILFIFLLGVYGGEDESKDFSRDAQCHWEPLCNGDLCSSVCKAGSVVVDEWTSSALEYQRKLQRTRLVPFIEVRRGGVTAWRYVDA